MNLAGQGECILLYSDAVFFSHFVCRSDVSYYDAQSNTWTKVGDLPTALNTPVCDIDFEGGWYYCFTGFANGDFAQKIRIEV